MAVRLLSLDHSVRVGEGFVLTYSHISDIRFSLFFFYSMNKIQVTFEAYEYANVQASAKCTAYNRDEWVSKQRNHY